MKIGRVYSYLRFSDPRQASGSSAERQTEYARRWASEHGLQLDASLSLRDEGLSAYHQRHVKQGALGAFLCAIDDGLIPQGSVLVVEGLDRLSRAEPLQAQAQLAQIINAGITVVTASDGREYNRERLRSQPMELVYSLLVMIRAYEESDTKSKRVRAAIRRQCEAWLAGNRRGRIRNGKDPSWLRWDGTAWQPIPERVEAVRFAIDLYRRNYGAVRIVRELSQRGLAVTPAGSSSLQIYRLIRMQSLIGIKQLTVDGEDYCLPDYYPPLLTEAEFSDLQLMMSARVGQHTKGEIPGIITGAALCYCGYCGTAMTAQNMMHRRRKHDGGLIDGHRRIICVGCSHNQGCIGGSSSVVPIEKALFRYCADQLNLSSLLVGDGAAERLRSELVARRHTVEEIERRIARLTEAMLEDEAKAPQSFVRKARELEVQLQQAKHNVLTTEHELAGLAEHVNPEAAVVWSEVRDAALALDYDARLRARRLVTDTFNRIVLYLRSVEPAHSARYIDMVMVSRTGQTRLLRIERRTGAWCAMEDVKLPPP